MIRISDTKYAQCVLIKSFTTHNKYEVIVTDLNKTDSNKINRFEYHESMENNVDSVCSGHYHVALIKQSENIEDNIKYFFSKYSADSFK